MENPCIKDLIYVVQNYYIKVGQAENGKTTLILEAENAMLLPRMLSLKKLENRKLQEESDHETAASTKCISLLYLQQGILLSDEVAKELVLTREQLMEFSLT